MISKINLILLSGVCNRTEAALEIKVGRSQASTEPNNSTPPAFNFKQNDKKKSNAVRNLKQMITKTRNRISTPHLSPKSPGRSRSTKTTTKNNQSQKQLRTQANKDIPNDFQYKPTNFKGNQNNPCKSSRQQHHKDASCHHSGLSTNDTASEVNWNKTPTKATSIPLIL